MILNQKSLTRTTTPLVLVVLFLSSLWGCRKVDLYLQAEEGEDLPGGQVTIFDAGPNAFGHQAPGLTGLDELEFFVGNSFFNQNWVSSPASTTARDGLGPLFNSRACSGCHFKDGRGRPPRFPSERGTGFLVRLGYMEGGELKGDPNYGHQLQDNALPGVPVEGTVRISYTDIPGRFADGSSYVLQQPHYELRNLAYGPLQPGILTSPRVANQMIGLGLLEAIPEAALLENADAEDRDGDGISGRPNRLVNPLTQTLEMGRFGWKANQVNLHQQTAAAFLGDMGITTDLFPDENCTNIQQDCQAAPNGGSPEIPADDLRKVILYVSTLAVPARREWDMPHILRGKTTFMEIGCAACHVPRWKTGQHPEISALSGQTIWPYTDLLLHDMGAGLADGRPDFEATGSEWRTPPLWGIGLFQTVNGHTNYLHDGRARDLTEAILWHGGEAASATEKFKSLSAEDRADLIDFLNSL